MLCVSAYTSSVRLTHTNPQIHRCEHSPLKSTQVKLPSWHLHLSRPSLCPFFYISLILSFSSQSFICLFCRARGCLIHSHSNAAPDSTQRAGLWGLPMATEVQGNGFKSVISFDVNFIVNNYESVQERASHWGNIYMPPVNPIMGVIELHSKSHTRAGATWSASNPAQLVIGWCLRCLGPLKICSLDGFFSPRSK